ncbi:hypothetical protein ALTERO38_50944 [Alteromonas sp. 38]|nr:hypothetical protein ALTER154_70126 [Alteromonas sp. 154]VXB54394.1 hypothetical protein ALTERO38_50944 [Alteromonas sp. 38]
MSIQAKLLKHNIAVPDDMSAIEAVVVQARSKKSGRFKCPVQLKLNKSFQNEFSYKK